MDAFLKMPRPDGAPSGLGTACLDEPTLLRPWLSLLCFSTVESVAFNLSGATIFLGYGTRNSFRDLVFSRA